MTVSTHWAKNLRMKFVEVHQAATNFSRLLAEVEENKETIVICRNGTPVANLVPHARRNRIRHAPPKQPELSFDRVDPMPPDEWPEAQR